MTRRGSDSQWRAARGGNVSVSVCWRALARVWVGLCGIALLIASHNPSERPSISLLFDRRDVVPSFVLMAVKGNKVVTYVYELRGNEVNVGKSEFTKAPSKK